MCVGPRRLFPGVPLLFAGVLGWQRRRRLGCVKDACLCGDRVLLRFERHDGRRTRTAPIRPPPNPTTWYPDPLPTLTKWRGSHVLVISTPFHFRKDDFWDLMWEARRRRALCSFKRFAPANTATKHSAFTLQTWRPSRTGMIIWARTRA